MPIQAATKGFAFIGKRGSGKSYGAAVFTEELFDASIPFVVFDPIDVWWGLKVSSDGKGKGLPVVVFGKEHADIQLDRSMGKKIAEAVVKENISCVISTFGMNKTEMREIVADFSERLLQINNTPRQVIIEEAHEYVPQRVSGSMARCFSAVEALLVMGRNRGIGVSLLNQRMATLNKDLLTQIDVLIAFRSVGPQDRKAFRDWVEVHNEENDTHFNEFMRSVPSLPTGEAWLWSPEFLEKFELIKFRKRNTFHPDREKIGITFKMPEIKQTDVQTFIDKFKTPKMVSMDKVIEKNMKSPTFAKAYTDEVVRLKVQSAVKAERAMMEKTFAKERVEMQHIIKTLSKTLESVGRLVAGVKNIDIPKVKITAPSAVNTKETAREVEDMEISGEVSNFTGGALRMIKALASRNDALTRQQLATMADVKVSGGSFTTYLSRLKNDQLIVVEGDKISLTTRGMEYATSLGDMKIGMSAADVRNMWLGKMTGGANRMLSFLIEQYPNEVSKEMLAEVSGVALSGGSFTTYLSRLKGNGLIEVDPSGVKASATLFDE